MVPVILCCISLNHGISFKPWKQMKHASNLPLEMQQWIRIKRILTHYFITMFQVQYNKPILCKQ